MNEIKEELKKEFEEKFNKIITPKVLSGGYDSEEQTYTVKEENGLDVIWAWFSQKLTEARMEQDCINQKYILDMQDEIARLAKIDENRHHSKVFPTETSQIIFTKQVFLDRITELEEELK